MSNAKKTVEYLDLNISLLDSQINSLSETIEKFEYNYDYMVMKPKIRENTLLINSNDLISFLGYLDISDWNELDQHRIKSEVKSQLEGLLTKALHADYRSHYQWCLAAVENLKWGRFIEEETSS